MSYSTCSSNQCSWSFNWNQIFLPTTLYWLPYNSCVFQRTLFFNGVCHISGLGERILEPHCENEKMCCCILSAQMSQAVPGMLNVVNTSDLSCHRWHKGTEPISQAIPLLLLSPLVTSVKHSGSLSAECMEGLDPHLPSSKAFTFARFALYFGMDIDLYIETS